MIKKNISGSAMSYKTRDVNDTAEFWLYTVYKHETAELDSPVLKLVFCTREYLLRNRDHICKNTFAYE